MIVREAYRDRTVSCCADHYAGVLNRPTDAPPLGRVEDARNDVPCQFCEQQREAVLAIAATVARRGETPDRNAIAAQLRISKDTVSEILHTHQSGWLAP